MKHLKKGRTLGRARSQRKALLAGLASSLFTHKRIMTTLAKAKEVRPYAERLITKARVKSAVQLRQVKKTLPRSAAKELFDVVAPKVNERKGGYLRIIKAGQRNSDAAPMAVVELVDFFTADRTSSKEGKKEKKASSINEEKAGQEIKKEESQQEKKESNHEEKAGKEKAEKKDKAV